MNCIDDDCKNLYSYFGELYCKLTKQEMPDDIDVTQCENFIQARTCINCKHSLKTVYETGTIDDIEYRCPFQDKKLIYADSNPYNCHFANVPECNIGKFEEIYCEKKI